MLKLKLQYFGHLMQRTDSLEKTLMLGKIEGGRRRGRQRIRWLDGITDSMAWVWASSGSWWWTGKPGVLQSMGSQRVGHDWVTKLNSYYILKIECVSHIDSTYQDHYISRAQATCSGFPAEKGKSRIWKYRQKNCKHLGAESSPNKCLEILLLTNWVFCLLDSLACLHVTQSKAYIKRHEKLVGGFFHHLLTPQSHLQF